MVAEENDPKKERYGGTRALMVGIVVFSLLSAVGAGYFGLRGGHSHTTAVAASKSVTPSSTAPAPSTPTTTPPTSPTSVTPTTVTPTTVTPTTVAPTTTSPTTPGTLADNPKPTAVPGGSFVVIRGNVKLTHVVVTGDTLFGISQWYKLMGGDTALYEWNHSTIGSNPNLIFPGEVLTITVAGKDIPKISPVWLAEVTEAS